MDHIVLNVLDDQKIIAFYSEILLLETERLEEYRQGKVPFPSVRLNPDTIIDLFPRKMWEKTSGAESGQGKLNHFCIALDKKRWDDLYKRLQENHISVEEGPVPRWGSHGTGTSIYFRDPEGTLIEARYYQGEDDAENCLLGS